jgi:hypothetical protein
MLMRPPSTAARRERGRRGGGERARCSRCQCSGGCSQGRHTSAARRQAYTNTPSQPACLVPRRHSRAAMAILKPCPSPPTMLAAGTRTLSRLTAAVGWLRQPILSSSLPKLRPGVPCMCGRVGRRAGERGDGQAGLAELLLPRAAARRALALQAGAAPKPPSHPAPRARAPSHPPAPHIQPAQGPSPQPAPSQPPAPHIQPAHSPSPPAPAHHHNPHTQPAPCPPGRR